MREREALVVSDEQSDIEVAKRRPEAMVKFVQGTLFFHVLFTLVVSGLAGVVGLFSLGAGVNGFSATLSLLSVYGFLAAGMMGRSLLMLRRSDPAAPTWTRVSLFVALPGTFITGSLGAVVSILALDGEPGLVVFGLPVALLAAAVFLALLRIIVKSDLDQLVWEDQESSLTDPMLLDSDEAVLAGTDPGL